MNSEQLDGSRRYSVEQALGKALPRKTKTWLTLLTSLSAMPFQAWRHNSNPRKKEVHAPAMQRIAA